MADEQNDGSAGNQTPRPEGTRTAATNAQTDPPAAPPVSAEPGSQPADAAPAAQPFRQFSTEDDLNAFAQDKIDRAMKSRLNKEAKQHGYKSWAQMQATLQILDASESGEDGEPGTPAAPTTPTTAPESSAGEAERLRLQMRVGAELGLPAALAGRLQGDTEDAMRADAEALQTLVGSAATPTLPGIPSAPPNSQSVTFTRAQLSDPKFVRENRAAIIQASREGRIVDS